MKPNIKEILMATYGEVPKPTPGEEMYRELLIDSGTFDEQQLKWDILQLAQSALASKDPLTESVALERWNTLYPKNRYSSIEMLVGVEVLE